MRETHPSRIFLWSCLAVLCGILIASMAAAAMSSLLMVLVTVLAFAGAIFWLIFPRLGLAGLLILFFAVGLLRVFTASLPPKDSLPLSALWNEEIIMRGIVVRDPQIRIDQTRLIVDIREAIFEGGERVRMDGRLLLFLGGRFTGYRYGDALLLEGKVVKPEPVGTFNWPAFLAKDGIMAVMYRPSIETEARGEGHWLLARLYALKTELRESLYRMVPPRHAAIVMAVLTGDEGGMSDSFQTALNRSGLRHIVAVSGMNITLVAGLTMAGLLSVGLWRQHAFWGALLLVVLFVLFVGAPPSAVRAGIMGALLLVAQRTGRMSNAATSVVGAGAVMAFVQPHALRWDAGFQLSFLAVLGILYFGDHIKERLTRAPDIFQLRDALAMTIAAQLTTIPFLIATFSYISPLGVLANILVVPLLATVTMLGFGLGALGILVPQGAFIFGLPLLPFASWVSFVAESLSKLSVLKFSLAGPSAWLAVGIYYVLLARFLRRMQKAKKWPIAELMSNAKAQMPNGSVAVIPRSASDEGSRDPSLRSG